MKTALLHFQTSFHAFVLLWASAWTDMHVYVCVNVLCYRVNLIPDLIYSKQFSFLFTSLTTNESLFSCYSSKAQLKVYCMVAL